MKFLREQDISIIQKDRIFEIAKLAIDASSRGEKVYNATLGTLYNEEKEFYTNPSFYTSYEKQERVKLASYSPTVDGGEKFANAVKNWVFQSNEYLKVSKVVATPGGTGALSTIFLESIKEGEEVIIPNIFWGPYEIIMRSRHIEPKLCACFKEGSFNLEAIKQAMLEVSKKQDNIVVVINDPCHNPTGYSMGIEKWEEFIGFCNIIAQNNKTVTIINDIAYIDYTHNFKHSRDYMKVFKNINDNVLVVFTFSGSKTLTAYGMRIGAAIIYANQQQDMENVHTIYEKVARGTWSSVNNGAIDTIIDVFENPTNFISNIEDTSKMLQKRLNVFLEEANKVGLKYYPTKEGFFITLVGIKNRNEELYQLLLTKNVFVVPMLNGIRVAICSLTLKDCQELPSIIQNTINELLK